MQASGSPRVPSHLTQGGTILCRAVGIGATCHSKGIWNKLHGHQTFIAFNAKYGAWMKKKYSRDGIWQNCSFKAYFFWTIKNVMICNKTHDEFFMPVTQSAPICKLCTRNVFDGFVDSMFPPQVYSRRCTIFLCKWGFYVSLCFSLKRKSVWQFDGFWAFQFWSSFQFVLFVFYYLCVLKEMCFDGFAGWMFCRRSALSGPVSCSSRERGWPQSEGAIKM